MPDSVKSTAPRHRSTLRRILFVKCFRSPSALMYTAWGLYAVLFILGPVAPVARMRWSTWGLIGLCVAVFHLGCVSSRGRTRRLGTRTVISPARLQRLVMIFAVIGILGGLFTVVDKIWLSGLDFSGGFTSARFESAELGSSLAASYTRSPLLYIGLLTYSFSVIAFATYILRADELPVRLLYVSSLSLLSPFAVAVVYGGRSVLFMALVLPLGALLVRKLRGGHALRRLKPLLVVCLLAAILTAVYDSRLQRDRRTYLGVADYLTELRYTESSRNFRVKPWVEGLINAGVPPDVALQILSLSLYTAQGPPHFDLMIHNQASVGPFYGQYEIASLGSWFGRTVPELSVVDRMYAELGDAKILGVFVTTWGALYADFGLIGMLVIAFFWGFVSSRVWRMATRSEHLGAQVLASFFFLTIIASPIHSAVGAGTGTFLALDVLVAYRLLSPKRKRVRLRGPSQDISAPLVRGATALSVSDA